eukprot:6461407-Amphidinium_carterae.1
MHSGFRSGAITHDAPGGTLCQQKMKRLPESAVCRLQDAVNGSGCCKRQQGYMFQWKCTRPPRTTTKEFCTTPLSGASQSTDAAAPRIWHNLKTSKPDHAGMSSKLQELCGRVFSGSSRLTRYAINMEARNKEVVARFRATNGAASHIDSA